MKCLRSHLLIASPELRDPNFAKSVVLIVQHNEEGAFGLVLNRRTSVSVRQAWEQVGNSPCVADETLFLGGPVDGPLMTIHTDESLSEVEIIPGVYFSVQPEKVKQLVSRNTGLTRYFVGFSGWGPGQLEGEMEQDSWLTLPCTFDHVFRDHDDLWERASKQVSEATILSALKIKHVPRDPSLN